MKNLGSLPENIPALNILDSLGENIIVSDKQYDIVWVNVKAASLLSQVVPLFGINDVSQIIGMNMSRFHKDPSRQEKIMGKLTGTHRARITIKNHFVADIIVNPVYSNEEIIGYVALLQDVTTKAEEEKRKEQLIQDLSIPILKVWDSTIAIPLFGSFDIDRGELLLSRVLDSCTSNGNQYVLIDVSGLTEYNAETAAYIKKLYDTLRLVGAECIIVGISSELAVKFSEHKFTFSTFATAQQGLEFILNSRK